MNQSNKKNLEFIINSGVNYFLQDSPRSWFENEKKLQQSGIVCSSGTLGQIIPPSIVLIILSDQLASASDAADNMRIENYKNVTGSTNILGTVSSSSFFLWINCFCSFFIH